MANIKQAAKWMEKGKRVRRPMFKDDVYIGEKGLNAAPIRRIYADGEPTGYLILRVDDLLADDWEIAE